MTWVDRGHYWALYRTLEDVERNTDWLTSSIATVSRIDDRPTWRWRTTNTNQKSSGDATSLLGAQLTASLWCGEDEEIWSVQKGEYTNGWDIVGVLKPYRLNINRYWVEVRFQDNQVKLFNTAEPMDPEIAKQKAIGLMFDHLGTLRTLILGTPPP